MPTAAVQLQNPTKNDLPEQVREQMVELLHPMLASSQDLAVQAKVAHWNVKGPSFIALHKLFDDAADQAREWTDEIAERIVQLGGVADATVQRVALRTELPEYPTNVQSGRDHVDAFSTALASFGARVRANIRAAGEAGDQDTADLFTEVSRSR